jgi:hypothetical protein
MKLTKSVVEGLPAPARGYTLHWDGQLKGFGIRVTARGVKTFVLQRRVNGKERRITIGRLGPLTTEQARREATKLLGAIATGRDPVAERKQAMVGAVTLGEAFAEYLSARGDLRPKTVKDYNRIMGISFGDWRKRPLLGISPGTWWAGATRCSASAMARRGRTCRCASCGRSSTSRCRATRWTVRRWSWITRSSACHGPARGFVSTAARP